MKQTVTLFVSRRSASWRQVFFRNFFQADRHDDDSRGLGVSSHLWPEISGQLLCCTPTADWLEYADWWNPILKNRLIIERGMAIIEGAIGSGIDWDEGAVNRFTL